MRARYTPVTDRLKVLSATVGTRPAGHKFYAPESKLAAHHASDPPEVKCELFNDRLESNQTVCGGCPGCTTSGAPSTASTPPECRRG